MQLLVLDSIPLAIIAGPGNEHDSWRFEQVVGNLRINMGRGRPRTKPGEVLVDAAYDTDSIQFFLRTRSIKVAFRLISATRRSHTNGGPLDLTMCQTMNEGLSMGFFGGFLFTCICSAIFQEFSSFSNS